MVQTRAVMSLFGSSYPTGLVPRRAAVKAGTQTSDGIDGQHNILHVHTGVKATVLPRRLSSGLSRRDS